MKCTKFDPFDYTTVASCCTVVFKTQFLLPDTLALTHDGAYINQQHKTFSDASIQWLEHEAFKNKIEIQHALSHREQQFGPYHVDGFCERDNVRTAHEFAGCFWHGCPKCYSPGHKNDIAFSVLYRQLKEKLQTLRLTHKLTVHIMWEYEWEQTKKTAVLFEKLCCTRRTGPAKSTVWELHECIQTTDC